MRIQSRPSLKLIIFLFFLLLSEWCFARAGGGGGGFGGSGSGGGGIISTLISLILAPVFLVYVIIMTRKLNKMKRLVIALTDELSKHDRMWNLRTMKARVEEVFFKVQKAWIERNQELSKDCMSDRIYTKHKFQTDALIAQGQVNKLERINLTDVTIFSVTDYKNDSQDTFSAQIRGTMIDYMIDEKTNKFISGNPEKPEPFTEIWKFIRVGETWLLDEIDQNVMLWDISEGKSWSEGKKSS